MQRCTNAVHGSTTSNCAGQQETEQNRPKGNSEADQSVFPTKIFTDCTKGHL